MAAAVKEYQVAPAAQVAGAVSIPGDKSISHRALMLGGIATGTTRISGFLASEDCLATLAALSALGKLGPLAVPALLVEIHKSDELVRRTAMIGLSATGVKSVPQIVEALRAEQDSGIVCALLESLARMGPIAADAVPAVLEATKMKVASLRCVGGSGFSPFSTLVTFNCMTVLITSEKSTCEAS